MRIVLRVKTAVLATLVIVGLANVACAVLNLTFFGHNEVNDVVAGANIEAVLLVAVNLIMIGLRKEES